MMNAVFEALERIDIESANEPLKALREERERLAKAIEETFATIRDLERQIGEERDISIAAADAVLAGTDLPDVENSMLVQGLERHRAAIKGLRLKESDATNAVSRANRERSQLVGGAFKPLIDELRTRAVEAGQSLIGIERACRLLGSAGAGEALNFANQLEDLRGALVEARLAPELNAIAMADELLTVASHPAVKALAPAFVAREQEIARGQIMREESDAAMFARLSAGASAI